MIDNNFIPNRIRARKDLLHFVEQFRPEVYEEIGKSPKWTERWLEELAIIHSLLIKKGFNWGIDIYKPPVEDPGFKNLGNNVFLYRGKIKNLTGLWISRETTEYDFSQNKQIPHTEWHHTFICSNGYLYLNRNIEDLNLEDFLPENFEPKSTIIKEDKRPILVFDIPNGSKAKKVYAKGSDTTFGHSYELPSYRLTNLVDIIKTTSKQEVTQNIELSKKGVHVPSVIGYYETPVEEFAFFEEVKGKNPEEFIQSHRRKIIEQDAQMLAVLCQLGYRKIGFESFEDKIFDGHNLYLIDVEELRDLYYPIMPNYRNILLNPSDNRELRRFRRDQRQIFKGALRDVLFKYKDSLVRNREDQMTYINSFYGTIGWRKPNEQEIKKLTTFPNDYMTLDTYMSIMADTD